MLIIKPAANYGDEINRKFNEYLYTEDYLLYFGEKGFSRFETVTNDCEGTTYQFAILDDEKLIGYISYRIDWFSLNAYNFGLFSFDRGNRLIGVALYKILNDVIDKFHIHRIEYRMISDNPVQRHYDRFCKKYNGNVVKLTDVFKDRTGKFRDEYIYEIIF
jgi:hypothetical protein